MYSGHDRTRSTPCPAATTLVAFAVGEASGPVLREVETHVDHCVPCHQLLAELLHAAHQSCAHLPSALVGLEALSGTTIDRFELAEVLGAGAMGVVYAASDKQLGRDVALKVIRSHVGSDGTDSATVRGHVRMLAEARALAAVQHPNVVVIHDVGIVDGTCYLVMERIVGQTLDAWCATNPSLRDRLRILTQIARGLAHAASLGVLHRDIKPSNVLVSGTRAVVIDFGVAELRRDSAEAGDAARIVGTRAYMAPEVVLGQGADERSDVYSLAVMAYECLDGYRPVAPQAAGVDAPPPPALRARVGATLRRVLRAGLARDPAQRPTSLQQVLQAFEPKQTGRRTVLAAMVVAAIAIGAFVVARPAAPSQASACDARVAQEAAAVWDVSSSAILIGQFAALDSPTVNDAALAVTRHLQDWRASWQAVSQRACHADRTTPATDMCLRQVRELALALRHSLARPTRDLAERAVSRAYQLPEPLTCIERPGAVSELLPANQDDRIMQQVAVLQRSITTSDVDQIRAGVDAVETDTSWRQHAERPLIFFTLGRAHEALDQGATAATWFSRAAHEADQRRQDYLRAEAYLSLSSVAVRQIHDPALRVQSLEHADTAIARIGNPPELHRRALAAHADVRILEGNDAEAAALLQRVVEIERELPASPLRARHLDMLGIALRDIDPVAAAAACTSAVRMFDRLLGPRHPDGAAAMMGLAGALTAQGKHQEAIEVLRGALARVRAVLPDAHSLVMDLRNNLALILAEHGQADEAIRELQTIMAVRAQEAEADDCRSQVPLARAQLDLGASMANADRGREGLALVEKGLKIYRACNVDPPILASALYFHGAIEAQVRGAPSGVASIEQALQLLARAPDLQRAPLLFLLAQLTFTTTPARSRRMAEQAMAIYREAGNTHDVDQISAWLSNGAVVP
jgi:tetratricopeptide (TPR) repeat protein/predicted Ser/Thr protein kinase